MSKFKPGDKVRIVKRSGITGDTSLVVGDIDYENMVCTYNEDGFLIPDIPRVSFDRGFYWDERGLELIDDQNGYEQKLAQLKKAVDELREIDGVNVEVEVTRVEYHSL